MILNLNMPLYFSKEHGVDDEIYWFFHEIKKYFAEREYSEIVKTVGLMPVVAPTEILNQSLWVENTKIDKFGNLAIISKQTDYLTYFNATIVGKKRLMVKNILSSIKSIEKRGKFNYKQFEDDLLMVTGFSKEELDLRL